MRKSELMLAFGVYIGFILALILIHICGFINFYQNICIYTSELEKYGNGDYTSDKCESDHMNLVEYSKNRKLAEKVRVLCWVMTGPQNHKTKAIYVKRTWGKRCNKLLFFSSQNDTELGAIKLKDVQEGRDYLWAKTKGAFKYIYENHFKEYDWFLKADDDTYIILENLRYFLKDHDTNYPIYFGSRFKHQNREGYMAGGPGYVLSKKALKRFIEKALPNKILCREDHGGGEDVEMAKCMQNIGVKFGDTRDALGRYRFNHYLPENHLIPGGITDKSFNYWSNIYYPQNQGMNCCSDDVISFHYVTPSEMYVMEYLIYHVKPYGIFYKLPENEIATKTNKNGTDNSSHNQSETLKCEIISNLLSLLILVFYNYNYNN